MAACPRIVDAIITSYDDLVGNTTGTTDGTAVSLRCEGGYVLDGARLVHCRDGRWDHPVPKCVAPLSRVTTDLTQTDLIVLTVCVVIATLVFLVLTTLIILYRRKMAQLHPKRGSVKLLAKNNAKPSVSYGNPLEDVFMEYSDYGEDYQDRDYREYPSVRDYRETPRRDIPLREYRTSRDIRDLATNAKRQRREHRLKRVQSLDRTFRDHRAINSFTPLSRTVSDSEWSRGDMSPSSFETSSSVLHFGPAVRWDPRRMYWHDSFDYSRSKIPRPQVGKTYIPNYFLQSGQSNTFG